jgi:hypothetical protein
LWRSVDVFPWWLIICLAHDILKEKPANTYWHTSSCIFYQLIVLDTKHPTTEFSIF